MEQPAEQATPPQTNKPRLPPFLELVGWSGLAGGFAMYGGLLVAEFSGAVSQLQWQLLFGGAAGGTAAIFQVIRHVRANR